MSKPSASKVYQGCRGLDTLPAPFGTPGVWVPAELWRVSAAMWQVQSTIPSGSGSLGTSSAVSRPVPTWHKLWCHCRAHSLLCCGACHLQQTTAILVRCTAAALLGKLLRRHAPLPAGISGSNHHLPARRISGLHGGDPTRRSSTSPSTTQRIRSINREAQINNIISERLDHWKQASGNRLVGHCRKWGRSQNGCACSCSISERDA